MQIKQHRTNLEVYPEDDPEAEWILQLDPTSVRLWDDDTLLGEWSGEEIVDRFLMPSFWKSRKGIAIRLKKHKYIPVSCSPAAVKAISDYFDRQYLRLHPHAALISVLSGIAQSLLGAAITVVAFYLTFIHAKAELERGDSFTYSPAGLAIGPILFVWGIYRASRYFRWKRLERELTAEEEQSCE